MKRIILIQISAAILLGCNSENKPTEDTSIENNKTENIVQESEETLPQFSSVREMFADASDFYEENGSLKFISEDTSNLHVQVSKPILESDIESVKEEIVKRDIIYVAFQTFAQTDLNKLTITAIPNDMENPKKYYDRYKKAVTVDRERAKTILKKYLGSEDFEILYKKDGTLWLPNENFSKLKFENLNAVYSDLSK
ncbi:MAG: hypothetical protein J5I47_12060 [Vicingus serpentipes]|nr:hypothetical protein [Vicingus serpentipes]